ncbi:hypothetical protein V1522DRAFT_373730, partial [Lipomyces starkeyi]
LIIGQHFATVFETRSYVEQYAARNSFAVKDGRVKNKYNAILLVCKCSGKTRNTRHLPAVVGTLGEVGVTRLEKHETSSPRQQLDDKWVIIELTNEHLGHQLEGVNPYKYPENRSLSEE